jgi:FkbM family methyltransferase
VHAIDGAAELIGWIKSAVRALLLRYGIVIFRRRSGIYIPEGESAALAVRLCGVSDPLIIDGGAHKGSFVDAVRSVGRSARFICFEPDPTLAAALRHRFLGDKTVTIVQCALADKSGRSILNINQSRATNSLLAANDLTRGALSDQLATVQNVEVQVTTLDDALASLKVATCDIIKLDLQGFDMLALMGACHALTSAQVVVVEAWFAAVYENTINYFDIIEFLRRRDFELYTLAGLHYGTNDRLLWTDAIFLKAESALFAEPISIA